LSDSLKKERSDSAGARRKRAAVGKDRDFRLLGERGGLEEKGTASARWKVHFQKKQEIELKKRGTFLTSL